MVRAPSPAGLGSICRVLARTQAHHLLACVMLGLCAAAQMVKWNSLGTKSGQSSASAMREQQQIGVGGSRNGKMSAVNGESFYFGWIPALCKALGHKARASQKCCKKLSGRCGDVAWGLVVCGAPCATRSPTQRSACVRTSPLPTFPSLLMAC